MCLQYFAQCKSLASSLCVCTSADIVLTLVYELWKEYMSVWKEQVMSCGLFIALRSHGHVEKMRLLVYCNILTSCTLV